MEFSELYKQSNSALAAFSPDGRFLAVAVEHRLIVRHSDNAKSIHRVYSTAYAAAPFIQAVAWSSDGGFVLTASYAQSRVDVWALADEAWRCAIVDEAAGVAGALWAPGTRDVLVFSDLDLRLSVWPIDRVDARRFVEGAVARVAPAFHPDGAWVAVAQRREYRDHVAIYSTRTWALEREVALDTVAVAGLRWSPDGVHVAAWDCAAGAGAVVVDVGGVVKRCLSEEDQGAVAACAWAPSAQLLAVAAYDGRVRLLDHLTWRAVATLPPRLAAHADVFVENEVAQTLAQESATFQATASAAKRRRTRFDLVPPQQPQPAVRVVVPRDVHRARTGPPGFLGFSPDGALLATVVDAMPHAVWIWDVPALRLAAVVQTLRPLRSVAWSPVENTLAMATGSPSVYLWKQRDGCHLFDLPSLTAAADSLVWNPDGSCLAVMCKGLFQIAYVTAT